MSNPLKIERPIKQKTETPSTPALPPQNRISSLVASQLPHIQQSTHLVPQTRSSSSSSLSLSALSLNGDSRSIPTQPLRSIFNEVLGETLPTNIISLISEYTYNSPFTPFVNLTDPRVLRPFLQQEFQDPTHLSAARGIAQRIYESAGTRFLRGGSNQHGTAFPMNPEILAYAMQMAKNEIVLEIAGASGENAILLAFAGAERVYMNELVSEEIDCFKTLKKQLPPDVRAKLDPIEGNCFEILQKKPKISNKVGLVLCQNLIHFFTESEQSNFCQLLKQILKPGGQAIFVVNSQYSMRAQMGPEVFEQNPLSSCFTFRQCLVVDRLKGDMPCAILYKDISIAQNSRPGSYTVAYIYTRALGSKWTADQATFKKLDSNIRPKIKKAIEDNQALLKPIQTGTVRILTSTVRIYNEENLSDLFRNHGFEVEGTFVVGRDGHLINDDADLSEKGQQLGVIVRSF